MISATGVFFIMTMGGLDFSQGSILGMASIVVCMVSKVAPVPVAVIAGIATGAGIGAINGFFYVNRKIKSFIVTICTMFLFRGIIKYLTSGAPVGANATMILLNKDQLKLICTLVVVVIGFVAFHFTKFGIHLRAIGAGEKAAKFAGIHTDRTKFLIYMLAGAITGFAGPVGLPVLGLVMGSYWIGNSIKDRKTEKALQEYQEIKRHLLQIEESYVRNDIIEEKTVSALETLDCLYNKKVELLINGDEIYLKTLEH
jgi:ribose transport system permease protein